MKAKVWLVALAICGLGFTACDKNDDTMTPAASAAPSSTNQPLDHSNGASPSDNSAPSGNTAPQSGTGAQQDQAPRPM